MGKKITDEEIKKLVGNEMQLVADLYKKVRANSKSFEESISRMGMVEICMRMFIAELKEGESQGTSMAQS